MQLGDVVMTGLVSLGIRVLQSSIDVILQPRWRPPAMESFHSFLIADPHPTAPPHRQLELRIHPAPGKRLCIFFLQALRLGTLITIKQLPSFLTPTPTPSPGEVAHRVI